MEDADGRSADRHGRNETEAAEQGTEPESEAEHEASVHAKQLALPRRPCGSAAERPSLNGGPAAGCTRLLSRAGCIPSEGCVLIACARSGAAVDGGGHAYPARRLAHPSERRPRSLPIHTHPGAPDRRQRRRR